MKLAGLKAVFLGDSITEGSGASSPDKVYWRVLGERTGLIVRGYGVGGTRIARQHSPSANERWDLCFNQRMYDMDKDADIVCVFGGTNDYGHGDAPIGGIDDNAEDTFYGALNHMYSYLVSTYPSSFIFAVTPLHRLNDKRNTGDGYKKPSGSLSDLWRTPEAGWGGDAESCGRTGVSVPRSENTSHGCGYSQCCQQPRKAAGTVPDRKDSHPGWDTDGSQGPEF